MGKKYLILMFLGIVLLSSLVIAQQREYPVGNVNGDGRIDITDPVYLLNFLFLGGPEPVGPGGALLFLFLNLPAILLEKMQFL